MYILFSPESSRRRYGGIGNLFAAFTKSSFVYVIMLSTDAVPASSVSQDAPLRGKQKAAQPSIQLAALFGRRVLLQNPC